MHEERQLLDAQAAVARAAGQPDDPYAHQRRWFGRFDRCLDAPAAQAPAYLTEEAALAVLHQALHHYHAHGAYALLAYCVMPNHVHLLVALPHGAPPLARTLQGLKAYTARHLNQLRGCSGQVWHRESYDHRVRNAAELGRVEQYILQNPVKAGLCAEWQQWAGNYRAD